MAKTKHKSKSAETPDVKTQSPDAKALAAKIDELDKALVHLVQQRAQLTLEAAKQGATPAEAVCTPVLRPAAIEPTDAEPLPSACIQSVLREVVSGCRRLVHEPRIAFLGPAYSYSHLAAIQCFGQSVEFIPVGTIAAVFEEVHRGQSDFGLVPIENSTDGRVTDTLDMFTRLRVRICGEVRMRIRHTLLGKCPRADVREVYSKPQALSQCRNWLAKHLPGARMIEVTSTTTAAQLAGEKPGAAAIASLQAGVCYGLDVLAEGIEDNPHNVTRFAVIGDHVMPPTGDDHTALLFQVAHQPGALADAMMIFKRNKLNLTWIESFPIPASKPGQSHGYLFFVEMEGHETNAHLQRALAALAEKTLRLEVLGSFPASAAAE